MKRGRSSWKPWYGRGGGNFQQSKSKPAYTIPNNSNNGNSSDDEPNQGNHQKQTSTTDVSFTTEREPNSFVGWKLYFPDKRKTLKSLICYSSTKIV